jgi:hypothetical protein
MSLFYPLQVGQQAADERRPPREIAHQNVLVVGMGTVTRGTETV